MQTPDEPTYKGYLYALGIVLSGMLQSLMHQWTYYFAWYCGLSMRVGLVNILFNKVQHTTAVGRPTPEQRP